eukprot:1246772-Amphidinium_carterae.1
MRLAVVGRHSLDELQELVEGCFGQVPAGIGQSISYGASAWSHLGRYVSIVPVQEGRTLTVYWPLPPRSRHLFAKPELYMAHVLGHEGSVPSFKSFKREHKTSTDLGRHPPRRTPPKKKHKI